MKLLRRASRETVEAPEVSEDDRQDGHVAPPPAERARRAGAPKGLLTIAIEGTSLRILAFRGRSDPLWVSLPFNPALLHNGFVSNPDSLSTVIGNALNSKGLLPKGIIARLRPWRVAAAFPSFQSQARIFNLPFAREVKPEEAIAREARRRLAYTPEEQHLYWRQVSTSEAQRQYFVLLVPRTPLQTFIATLNMAGLRPRKVVLKPLALASLVTHDRAVVANIENNSIDITLVVNSIPVVMRSAFLGSELLNADSAAPRLVEELNRTIAYYNDANRDAPIPDQAPVYLSGALAADPDLIETVERDASLSYVSPHLPVALPPDYPLHQLTVNAALAAPSDSSAQGSSLFVSSRKG